MAPPPQGGLVRPPPIARGSAVALVAPSGPFDRDEFDRGVAAIEARGFRCKVADSAFARRRYLAGDDDQRLRDLVAAFDDAEVAAIWCVRGGYGALRLLPRLPFERLPHKAVVGFSDITALHAALQARGRASIHGPVVTRIALEPAEASERLFALLEGRPTQPVGGARAVVPGRAKGRLLGGNLAVLSRLAGTPFLPDFRGAILLIEEVAERPYRLDRMWTHLRLAGVLDGVAGVAVGRLSSCEEPGADYTAEEVMADLLRELKIPSAMGFPIGHGGENRAVLLGGVATLDADAGVLEG